MGDTDWKTKGNRREGEKKEGRTFRRTLQKQGGEAHETKKSQRKSPWQALMNNCGERAWEKIKWHLLSKRGKEDEIKRRKKERKWYDNPRFGKRA